VSEAVIMLREPLSGRGAIAAQVTDALRAAIVRLDLPPGSLVSEAEIARRYGVSRQPVREAFIKLQEAGLLAIRPQRGTMVQPISVVDVMNARFVREAVEAAVVREAASARPAGLENTLRDLLRAQADAEKRGDADRFLELDEAFHRALAEAIGRGVAWSVLEGIKAQMDRVRYLSFEGASPLGDLVRQHQAIARAVGAGDADAAEAAMRTHLREILSSLPKIAAAHPDYFTAPRGTVAPMRLRTDDR